MTDKRPKETAREWAIDLDELPDMPPQEIAKMRRGKVGGKRRSNPRAAGTPTSPQDRCTKRRKELREIDIHCPARHITAEEKQNLIWLKENLQGIREKLKEDASRFKGFNRKQVTFLRFYMLNGYRSVAKSMRQAGYVNAEVKGLETTGSLILKKAGASELLAILEQEERFRVKITIDQVVAWFQKIADAAMETNDLTNANRAMENLAKYLGMFVDKKVIEHRTISNKEELDARIRELTEVLSASGDEIVGKLRVH